VERRAGRNAGAWNKRKPASSNLSLALSKVDRRTQDAAWRVDRPDVQRFI
jgi:hypothetical protein